MKKPTPVIRNAIRNESILAPVNVRDLKKLNGIIGFSAVSSTRMKDAAKTAAATNEVRIQVSVQPRLPASIRPQVRLPIANVIKTVPGISVATVPLLSRD